MLPSAKAFQKLEYRSKNTSNAIQFSSSGKGFSRRSIAIARQPQLMVSKTTAVPSALVPCSTSSRSSSSQINTFYSIKQRRDFSSSSSSVNSLADDIDDEDETLNEDAQILEEIETKGITCCVDCE
jgi:hypothetical protein